MEAVMKVDLEAFAGHTPGPWRVEQNTTLVWGDCNQDDSTTYGMGYPVAEAKQRASWAQFRGLPNPTDDEIDANARLIAAAPDMAQEIRELRELVKAQHYEQERTMAADLISRMEDEITRLRAELANARAVENEACADILRKRAKTEAEFSRIHAEKGRHFKAREAAHVARIALADLAAILARMEKTNDTL